MNTKTNVYGYEHILLLLTSELIFLNFGQTILTIDPEKGLLPKSIIVPEATIPK